MIQKELEKMLSSKLDNKKLTLLIAAMKVDPSLSGIAENVYDIDSDREESIALRLDSGKTLVSSGKEKEGTYSSIPKDVDVVILLNPGMEWLLSSRVYSVFNCQYQSYWNVLAPAFISTTPPICDDFI